MNRKTILLFVSIAFLFACGSARKFQAASAEDKPLFDAINALNKKSDNQKALMNLRELYARSVERHEEAIDVYKHGADIDRWDRVLTEYNALQHIYNSLQATPASFSVVKPKNYLRDIEQTKTDAAEDYYTRGKASFALEGRENSLEAWQYFRRSQQYVPGYKDSDQLIRDAYEKSIVNVVINPIVDETAIFSGSFNWSLPDLRYRPQDYQDQLVRELGGRTANTTAARFYTDREIRREGVAVDWEINLRWKSLSPQRPSPTQTTRQVSKSVENGKDSTGKPVYKTVYATLTVTQNTFKVQGDFEYLLMDIAGKRSLDNGFIRDEVSWIDNSASYTGDSRALSQEDWALVNNRSGLNQPTRGDVLNKLMQKLFPELKKRLQQRVR